MIFSDNFLISDLGKKIYLRKWYPKNKKINNVVLIVHGLGEHSGRYEHIAEKLTSKNAAVFALDLIGHGKSEGKRGHIKSINEYLDSIEKTMILIRRKFLEIPIIIYGHSLGGLVCLKFLIERESKEISKAILSSPWIETKIKIPNYLLWIHKILHRIFPKLQLNNNLNIYYLSKEKSEVIKYKNDKLVHNKISLNLFSEILNSIHDVKNRCNRINVPSLLFHGEDDKIISFNGTKYIHDNIKNSKFILFKNVYHEPHNDSEKLSVIHKIIEFIN